MATPSTTASSSRSSHAHLTQSRSLPPSSSDSSGRHLALNLASPPSSITSRFRSAVGGPIHISSAASFRVGSVLAEPTRTGSSRGGPDKSHILRSFRRHAGVDGGTLEVRLMAPEEEDAVVKLLAESFADAMWMPPHKVRFLEFWVRQYLRQKQLPHAATLVGIYQGTDGGKQVAGTAEVCFDAMGARAPAPTPSPPRDAPYLCNMTVRNTLRRKRIGWNLLKACEDLVVKMCGSTEVYLHCRMIDKDALEMYKKAGYEIAETDSYVVWLRFQRRKHLMKKVLKDA